MQVTIHQAKTQLSKLLEAVANGEEVIIAKGKVPVAEIIPVRKKFKHGILKGIVPPGGPDFLAPMSEDELKEWEGD
jgi:prevent-host-death family protein